MRKKKEIDGLDIKDHSFRRRERMISM